LQTSFSTRKKGIGRISGLSFRVTFDETVLPMPENTTVRPDAAFLPRLEQRSGEKPSLCYQCRKCTNGCPLTFAMDLMPNQIMQMAQLGLEDELLRSKTIWVCASCQTCTTRCPNDIDIAHLVDSLRQLSREAGVASQQKIVKFHDAFLDSIRRHGRMFELGMIGRYKLSSMDLLSGTRVGMELFKRGKLKFFPENVEGKAEIRKMFDKQKGG
jgi:heterodisulfide reductase subunit C